MPDEPIRVTCDTKVDPARAVSVRIAELNAAGCTPIARCDVRDLEASLRAVDLIARLQLEAVRVHGGIALEGACAELADLVELAGLASLMPVGGRVPSGVEVRGKAEEREQASGVEEERDAADLRS